MKKKFKYSGGALIGFLLGFIIIHPFSMVFQDMVHPTIKPDFKALLNVFNPHHLPMAFFFGLLGVIFGVTIVFYLTALTKERERVRLLEELLPICAYCKKIRDDTGKEKGKGEWYEIEQYISKKTNTDFTHGVCPDCFKKLIKELEGEAEPQGS
jgi:hypothetical protein